LSQSVAQSSSSLQISWASGDEGHLLSYQEVVLSSEGRWCCQLGTEQTVWERGLQHASSALVIFSEAYRTACKPGSQLMSQARHILSRALEAGFRVVVLDPAGSGQGPESLRLFLSHPDPYPHLNIETLRSFVSKQRVIQDPDTFLDVAVLQHEGDRGSSSCFSMLSAVVLGMRVFSIASSGTLLSKKR